MTKKDEQFGKLEQAVCDINKRLDELMGNHLVHIADDIKELQNDLTKIKIRMALWAGGGVVAIWLIEHFMK